MILFELFFSSMEAFIFADFLTNATSTKISITKKMIALIIASIIGFFIGTMGFSIFTLLIIPFLVAIALSILYRARFIEVLFLAFTVTLFSHLFDSLLFGLLGLVLGQEHFLQIILYAGLERILFGSLAKVSFLLIYMLYRNTIKQSIEIMQSRWYKLIILVGLFLVILLSHQMLYRLTFDVGMSVLFFSSSLLLLLFILYYSSLTKSHDTKRALIEQRNDILTQNYEDILEAYKLKSMFSHDYKQHLSIIQRLVQSKKYEELREYIDELTQATPRVDYVWTNDVVVNYILQTKIGYAESLGIEVDTQIEFPDLHDIKPSDLTAILANVLENAIEASSKVHGKCWIGISMKSVHSTLLIKVENTFAELPKKRGSEFLTSKDNKLAHGWGLKSVEVSAAKYDGCVTISIKEQECIFEICVSLSFDATGSQ